tara:strand:- start:219 stop:473 length:255 start_codon:yes stop_codon:yes gene_type:complete
MSKKPSKLDRQRRVYWHIWVDEAMATGELMNSRDVEQFIIDKYGTKRLPLLTAIAQYLRGSKLYQDYGTKRGRKNYKLKEELIV